MFLFCFVIEIRRFYGKDNSGGYDAWRQTYVHATPFDFDKAESTKPKGHCVAVRVTSEDPDDGFKPTSGKVQVCKKKKKHFQHINKQSYLIDLNYNF